MREKMRLRKLFYLTLVIGMVNWGCASLHSRNDYNRLVEKQMEWQSASARAEKRALDKVPEMTDQDYERLGDAHFQQGKLGRAFVQYEKALQLNPDRAQIHYKKGLLFVVEGLTKEAIAEFQEVLKKEPNHALAYEGMGLAFFKSGRSEAAEEHFQKALDLDPSLWKAHTFLGIIYNHQSRFKAAVRQHKAAITLEPDKGILYNNLGISYAMMGEYKKALEAFETALKDGTSQNKIYNNLGLVLSKLGRYEEALEAFKLAGDEAQAYNNLGCVYLQKGDRDKAIRCFEQAIELKPTFYDKASRNLEKAKPTHDLPSVIGNALSNTSEESESPAQDDTPPQSSYMGLPRFGGQVRAFVHK
jgi:tetratricopeptide (TPR) repeat protein